MLSISKLHLLILYCILAFTLLLLGYGLLRQPAEPEVKVNKGTKSDNRMFFWEIYPELVVPNTGKVIDKTLRLRDKKGEDITVQDLSKKMPFLVFRYSRYDCQLCVDQVLGKLQTVFEGVEDQVCLIIDGMTEREFRLRYKDRNIGFLTYFVFDDNLELSLENKNLPFLFVLSPETMVDKIFIPFREYPNQTDAYLKNIKVILSD